MEDLKIEYSDGKRFPISREISRIILTFPVLYSGWECDETAWVVGKADGTSALIMTSHGAPYVADSLQLATRVHEYKKALADAEYALALLKGE